MSNFNSSNTEIHLEEKKKQNRQNLWLLKYVGDVVVTTQKY